MLWEKCLSRPFYKINIFSWDDSQMSLWSITKISPNGQIVGRTISSSSNKMHIIRTKDTQNFHNIFD